MKLKIISPLFFLLLTLPVLVSCVEDVSPYPFEYQLYISYDCLRRDSVRSMHVATYKDGEKECEREIGIENTDGGPLLTLGAVEASESVKNSFTYVYYISAPSVPSWAGRTDTLVAMFSKHCEVQGIYYNGIDMRNLEGDIHSETGLYSHYVNIHVTK